VPEATEHVDGGARLEACSHDLDVSVLEWHGRPVHLRATYLRHPGLVTA
jgi:hypothetical protein